MALQVGDVDFLGRVIHVRRQMVGGYKLAAPKHQSEREVEVPDELLEMLAAVIKPGASRTSFVFGGEVPVTFASVWSAFNAAMKASDPARPYRFHDLRHFFASSLIVDGCDVATVRNAMGHNNATITLNTYVHLWPNAGDRVRRASSARAKAIADYMRTTAAAN